MLRSGLTPANPVGAARSMLTGRVELHQNPGLAAVGRHDGETAWFVSRGPLDDDIASVGRPTVMRRPFQEAMGTAPSAVSDVQVRAQTIGSWDVEHDHGPVRRRRRPAGCFERQALADEEL